MKAIVALGLAASIGLGGSIALGSPGASAATVATGHTAWCDQQYRSYNAATDTYTGYDGLAHRCISPATVNTIFGSAGPLVVVPNSAVRSGNKNPNGFGSGTSFRLYPDDSEGGNNGTTNY